MKLRRVELRNVRKFQRTVVVDRIGDGVNLIVGANEAGKSTLLAGLRAGLFLKHGSRAAEVRSLRHYRHETAPEIALEIEHEGRWRIEKRFLQGAYARLRTPDGRVAEGDPGEALLRRLLGGDETAFGFARLLLIGQGDALEAAVTGDARSVLQASLEAALGPEAGARSAGGLIERLDQRLRELVHAGHGAPVGQHRRVLDELRTTTTELAAAEARLADDRRDLDDLEAALAEHRALGGGRDDHSLEAEIQALEGRRQGVDRWHAARLRRDEAKRAAEARRARIVALEQVAQAQATAEQVCEAACERRAALAVDGRQAKARLERAEASRASVGRAFQALRELQELERQRYQIEAALGAEAAEVALDLTEAGLAAVRLDGQAAPAGRVRLRVRDRLTVELGPLGRLEVRPAAERVDRLRDHVADLDARSAALRAELSTRSPAVFEAHPALDAARYALQAAYAEAEAEEDAARSARVEIAGAWKAAEIRVRELDEALQTAKTDRERVARELAEERGRRSDATLEAELARAEREVALLAPADADQIELADLDDQLRIGRTTLARRRDERHALERRIERLQASIETRAAANLREQVEQLEQTQAHLRNEAQRLARDVEVMRLLRSTLQAAEADVRERYLRPLLDRLHPSLDLLLPGIEVTLDDGLAVRRVHRPGGTEPYDQVSHGTREQIAVAVRLAFAELLIETGRPCFVVLDDALVFSDDDRLERMFRLIERAGRKVQILILTCRGRAFGSLRAQRLRIEALEEVATA